MSRTWGNQHKQKQIASFSILEVILTSQPNDHVILVLSLSETIDVMHIIVFVMLRGLCVFVSIEVAC